MTTEQNSAPDAMPGFEDIASEAAGLLDGGKPATPGQQSDQKPDAKPAQSADGQQDAMVQNVDDKKKDPGKDLLFGDDDKGEKPEGEETADGEKKDESEDGEKKDDEKEAEAPQVDFDKLELPADMPVQPELKERFLDIVNSKDMSKQEQTQALVDMHVDMMNKANDAWFDTVQSWRDETMADPDLGGQNIEQTISNANEVMNIFATDKEHLAELQGDLKYLGLGNKKSFIRFLNNIHSKVGDDSIANTFGRGGEGGNKPHEKVLWPDMA